MDLIARSIFIFGRERSNKEIKACHIPDFSHDVVMNC